MKKLTLLALIVLTALVGCDVRPETDVTSTSASLHGSSEGPTDNSGYYRFRVCTGSTCHYEPSEAGNHVDEGVDVADFAQLADNLTPNSLYYYQLEFTDETKAQWGTGETVEFFATRQYFHNEWYRLRTSATGSFRPHAFYRPYEDSAFINQKIPAGAATDSTSSSVVTYLNNAGPQPVFGRAPSSDYQHPVYYRRNSDTGDDYYRINCTKYGGDCEIDDEIVQIPDGASGAGRNDGHLAVINQDTGIEHDLWQVNCNASGGSCQSGYDTASKELPAGGSSSGTAVTLNIGYGGKTSVSGADAGRLSDATAAHFGLAAGLVRREELDAARIEHALVLTVPCVRSGTVWPAGPNNAATCNSNGPNTGALLQLTGTDVDNYINGTAPAWKRAIVRAMRDYGAYVLDTGGSSWYFHFESDESERTFGRGEPIYSFAQSNFDSSSSTYSYPFGSNPTENFWDNLRVVDECAIPTNPNC